MKVSAPPTRGEISKKIFYGSMYIFNEFYYIIIFIIFKSTKTRDKLLKIIISCILEG